MSYHVTYSALGMRREPSGPLMSSGLSADHFSPLAAAMEAVDFIRCDSMAIANDPRFFSGNVIDKRLTAFGVLSVVSALLVQNAIDQSFDMRKDLNFSTVDGWAQAIGFAILCFVLFANLLATYVGVAQPYHTYRLMTAGPTGFEMAAAYYLNKRTVYWRHLTIKTMLWSMPLYLVSSGFRFVAKFPRDLTAEKPLPNRSDVPLEVRIEEFFVLGVYLIAGGVLYYIHREHEGAFRDNFESLGVQSGMGQLRTAMQNIMMPRSFGTSRGGPLDV